MARPTKPGADWFKHDSDMRHDPKVLALRHRYPKGEGYAVWNMTLEMLTDCEGWQSGISDQDLELIAGDFGIEPVRLREILDYCVSICLLQRENGSLSSFRHKERMSVVDAKREADRQRLRSKRVTKKGDTEQCRSDNHATIAMSQRQPSMSRVVADSRNLEKSREEVLDTSSLTRSSDSVGAGGASNGASAPTPEERRDELERQAAAGNPFAAMKARELHRKQPAPDLEDGIPW
jgi:hypothetical protein